MPAGDDRAKPVPTQLRALKSNLPVARGWRLVRTPGPDKEGDTISMMRTADLLNSDPDFAGMMIRCQDKHAPQIAFVVVTPFKPRSKARIAVSTGRSPARFDATIIGPGSMVALPDAAAPLLHLWQAAKTLNVEITGEEATVKGVVPLAGLSDAVAQLETSCVR
jgi:hypothetical protein